MGVNLQSVNRLLAKNGNDSFSIRRMTTTSFDPDNPTQAPTKTTTDYTLSSYAGQYKRYQIDGELVRTGDIKLYVDPTDLSITPSTADRIINGSEEWDIIDVKKYTQQDTVVLYILQIRN